MVKKEEENSEYTARKNLRRTPIPLDMLIKSMSLNHKTGKIKKK